MSAAEIGGTLYVSDLDGTLLGEDGRLSDESARILDELVADGARFTVATARSYGSTRRGLAGLELPLPHVVYSGASAVDPATGSALWWEHFDGRIVHPLMAASLAAGITPLAFWLQGDEERISWVRGAETPGVDAFLARREGDPRLSPVDAWDEVDHDSTFFVSLVGDRAVLRRLARMVRAISWGTGCALALAPHEDDPTMAMLDVTSSEATKATGVQRVAQQLGAERIVAFGDGANDLPLFAIADESYAAPGATDEVKAAATAVLEGPADEAVARFLADRLGRAVA